MRLLNFILFTVFFSSSSLCQEKFLTTYTPICQYTGQTIWDVVSVKEKNMDIGLWSLIIAKEFDGSIDIERYMNMLDKMVTEINFMIAGRNRDMDKFLATRHFVYVSGAWNNYQNFDYDLDDPLGKRLRNQLLSTYLETRRGNCVSMPTLFLALMERVDPNVPFCGVSVPLHLFCRLRDRQTGDIWNVETTNGGNPARNQWYIERDNISQKALDSGIYLRDMTKKDYIAKLITNILAVKERRKGNFEKALKYVELSLKLDSDCVNALVQKAALLAELGYQIQEKAIQRGEWASDEEREKVKWYFEESERNGNKAFFLGWQPETPEQRQAYLDAVKTEQQRRKKSINSNQ